MTEANETPRFLLLLPPIPTLDFAQLKTGIFGDTIAQVLKEVAQHATESHGSVGLEIALACPELNRQRSASYADLFQATQTLLATIYKLIGVIATRDDVNIDEGDGVEVCVILVAWSPNESTANVIHHRPVISLQALATSKRPWQFAFGVENDAGEAFVRAFVAARSSSEHTPNSIPSTTTTNKRDEPLSTHQHVILGGTFDHLHIGHKLLLTMLLFTLPSLPAEPVEQSATIGITGDELLVNKKYANVLQDWDDRRSRVAKFLDTISNFTSDTPQVSRRNEPGPNGKSVDCVYRNGLAIKCTEIKDPYGPTITVEYLTALVISGETRSGGQAVNDRRREKSWTALEIFEVDVLHVDETAEVTAGFEGKISSTGIRKRIAERAGEH